MLNADAKIIKRKSDVKLNGNWKINSVIIVYAQRFNSEADEIMQRRVFFLFVLKLRFEFERWAKYTYSQFTANLCLASETCFRSLICCFYFDDLYVWVFYLIGSNCPRCAQKGPDFQHIEPQRTHRMDVIIDFVLDMRCISTTIWLFEIEAISCGVGVYELQSKHIAAALVR